MREDALAGIRLERLNNDTDDDDWDIPDDKDLPQDVKDEMARHKKEEDAIIGALPDYMIKLFEGYKPTHCGFEIVESLRKVSP